jgi:hypothetical protein
MGTIQAKPALQNLGLGEIPAPCMAYKLNHPPPKDWTLNSGSTARRTKASASSSADASGGGTKDVITGTDTL